MIRSYFLLFFAPVVLTACSGEETVTTDNAPETAGMNNTTDLGVPNYAITPAEIELSDISGKVFFFAPDLDTTLCESFAECDCCADDYLFLDDERFLRISYCSVDQTIFKGTYAMSHSEITLHYDTTSITRTYDGEMQKAGIPTGDALYLNEIVSSESFSETFTAWKCKDGFFLKASDENLLYGTQDQQTTLKTEIEFLRIDGTWDLIKW